MESPVILENCANFAMPVDRDETGFPFEDDYRFEDRLNNIAQRHPEFADSLRFDDFPTFRRKRNGSGSSDQQDTSRFGVGPSRFGLFNNNRFPFTSHFEDEFADTPAQSRHEKPPEVPKSQEKRGRKPNPNLPQHLSNTVDLGQKQPPVEEARSQRSMSAPPENRSTQSSRVEHEVPEEQNMGKSQSRPNEQPTAAPGQAKERIIPIHVEGRDEPVLPKNPHSHHANSGPQPEKVFGHETFFKGTDPYAKRQQAYDQFAPRQQTPPYQQPHYQQQHHQQQHHQQQPHFQQAAPQHHKQATPPPENRPNQQQQHHHQQPQQQPQQPQQQQQQQRATPPPSNDPLDKIKIVKNDVLDLMTKVENFQGTRKDREYLYLDEMLTRNLIKLDNIQTDGRENIRSARKEAIKCVQTCINNLEARAQNREKELLKAAEEQQTNAANQNQGAEGIVAVVQSQPEAQNQNSQEQQQQQTVCPPTYKTEATINLSGAEQQPSSGQDQQQMEVEPPQQRQETTEQSSGAGSGSGSTPMEVDTHNQQNNESAQSNSSQAETTSK